MGLEGAVLEGKYRVGRCIGEGGMGAVYEAVHVGIGRRVAVKVLHPDIARKQEAVARLKREAQIAGSLGHDNICEVLDLGTTPDGMPYVVMPLLRGASLAEVIAEKAPLPVKRALDLAAQILSALSAAHHAGVVHRDLKPENVFVTCVGDRSDFVKILDFGISKVRTDGSEKPQILTRTGAMMGTPYYMAPEQARGQKDQDHRVDLYAVGVILYEMLTGRRPFEGESLNELLVKIMMDPFPPPRNLRDGLPPEIDALVLRAMMRDREHRFADAVAMREEISLARLCISEPTGRTPLVRVDVTNMESTTPFAVAMSTGSEVVRSSRGRPLALAVVAIALGMAAAAWFSGWFDPVSPPAVVPAALPSATAPLRPAPFFTPAPAPAAAVPDPARGTAAAAARLGAPGTTADAGMPATAGHVSTKAQKAVSKRRLVIRGRAGASVVTNNEE